MTTKKELDAIVECIQKLTRGIEITNERLDILKKRIERIEFKVGL